MYNLLHDKTEKQTICITIVWTSVLKASLDVMHVWRRMFKFLGFLGAHPVTQSVNQQKQNTCIGIGTKKVLLTEAYWIK